MPGRDYMICTAFFSFLLIPDSVISSPAAPSSLPTRALASLKARESMGPEGGTPICHSLILPGQSCTHARTHKIGWNHITWQAIPEDNQSQGATLRAGVVGHQVMQRC